MKKKRNIYIRLYKPPSQGEGGLYSLPRSFVNDRGSLSENRKSDIELCFELLVELSVEVGLLIDTQLGVLGEAHSFIGA